MKSKTTLRWVCSVSRLLFSVLLVTAISGAAMASSSALPDPCQPIRDRISALEQQLQKVREVMVGPYGKPGEPLKPVKDPESAKLVKELEEKIDAEQEQLAKCEAPPQTPPLAISAFTAQSIGSPDPQIAVGHKYFAAIDTSDLVFYDKSTMQPVPAGPGLALPSNPLRMTSLFSHFLSRSTRR